jgi:phage terminase large subunit
MSPEAFEQEIGADFGSFVGKIYPEWDIGQHVTNVKFNPAWPNYIAFDWGYTNPLAAIEFQVSPNDEIFVWREHYKSYMTVKEHCKVLKQREQPDGYHINLTFGDAADPEAAETVSNDLAPCIADPDAKVNWREGIDLVRSFMERETGDDEFGGPTYAPAFHVDFSCVNTIREFNNYKAPDSVKGKNVQEIGIRQDDHALDALRYGLVHIFKLGATHHLAEVIEMTTPDPGHFAAASFAGSDFSSPIAEGGFFTTAGGF